MQSFEFGVRPPPPFFLCKMPRWDRNVGERVRVPICSRYTFGSDRTELSRALLLQLQHFILRVWHFEVFRAGSGRDFEFGIGIYYLLLPPASYSGIMSLSPSWTRSSPAIVQTFNFQNQSEKVLFFRALDFGKKPLISIIGWLLRISYGAPLSRRRLYLFLFRKDILKQEAKSYAALFDMMQKNLKRMHVKEKHQWHLAF